MTTITIDKIKIANTPRGAHSRDVASDFSEIFPETPETFTDSSEALFDINTDGIDTEILGDDRINFAILTGSVTVEDYDGLITHTPWLKNSLYPALLRLQNDSVINSVRIRIDGVGGSALIYYASNKVLYAVNTRDGRSFPCSARELTEFS